MTYLETDLSRENASCFILLSRFSSSCLHFLLSRLPLFVPSTVHRVHLNWWLFLPLQLRAAFKRSRPRQSCALQLFNSHSLALPWSLSSILHLRRYTFFPSS